MITAQIKISNIPTIVAQKQLIANGSVDNPKN